MEQQRLPERRRRNRNFDETHRLLIEKTVELISELGTEALSISALARESGINRSTVYYHFESREALIDAVQAWSSAHISEAFRAAAEGESTINQANHFIMTNPEVMKLWIDEFIARGEIRDRYPLWDVFVDIVRNSEMGRRVDPEMLSITLLAGCMIGARIYHASVRPDMPLEQAIKHVSSVQTELLRQFGLA